MSKAIAVIKYQVKPGTNALFLARIQSAEFAETVKHYPGFVSYTLVNTGGESWCEFITWESMDAAKHGAQSFQTTQINAALQPFQVLTSFEVSFLETAVSFQ